MPRARYHLTCGGLRGVNEGVQGLDVITSYASADGVRAAAAAAVDVGPPGSMLLSTRMWPPLTFLVLHVHRTWPSGACRKRQLNIDCCVALLVVPATTPLEQPPGVVQRLAGSYIQLHKCKSFTHSLLRGPSTWMRAFSYSAFSRHACRGVLRAPRLGLTTGLAERPALAPLTAAPLPVPVAEAAWPRA
jgi:hypothetical protein